MKKKIIVIVTLLCVAILCIGSLVGLLISKRASKNTPDAVGNTAGNLYNKGYFCESKECSFALWKNNRFFESLNKKLTRQVAEKLIKDGKAKLKGCKSAKTGKTYDCTVVMTVEDGRCNFRLEFENRR